MERAQVFAHLRVGVGFAPNALLNFRNVIFDVGGVGSRIDAR